MSEATNTVRHEVEVDTRIAEAATTLAKSVFKLNSLVESQKWAEKNSRRPDPSLTDRISGAKVLVATDQDAYDEVSKEYGGWSRFFLVTNNGGHIHRWRACSTCYPSTEFAWLPELSGLTDADAVEEYGGILCSVCYPDAPTAWTEGENKKEARRKEIAEFERRLAKTSEGKKVKSSKELRDRKLAKIQSLQRSIDHVRNFDGDAPEFVVKRAADAKIEMPKIEKQYAAAERKHAAALDALQALLLSGEEV